MSHKVSSALFNPQYCQNKNKKVPKHLVATERAAGLHWDEGNIAIRVIEAGRMPGQAVLASEWGTGPKSQEKPSPEDLGI